MNTTHAEKKSLANMSGQNVEIILVSGMSGAGMSTALQVLEDLNFFTADGLPLSMIPEFARLASNVDMQHFRGIALGIDLRKEKTEDVAEELNSVLEAIRKSGNTPILLSLKAQKDILLRRYATTRRPHPLEKYGYSLEESIQIEEGKLQFLDEFASMTFDTSDFSIHDLRRALQNNFTKLQNKEQSMRVNLMSFGFKYGVPKEADIVFDVRFLTNPYFDEKLRPCSGLDQSVVDYVFHDEISKEFRERLHNFIEFSLPLYNKEGRYRICLAIGCTGGRHRSVATTEFIAEKLREAGYTVSTEHRHLNLDSKK